MRHHKLLVVLAAVLVLLTLAEAVVPVYASTLDEKQKEKRKSTGSLASKSSLKQQRKDERH